MGWAEIDEDGLGRDRWGWVEIDGDGLGRDR